MFILALFVCFHCFFGKSGDVLAESMEMDSLAEELRGKILKKMEGRPNQHMVSCY